jgi:hypothetical protein
LKEGFEFHLIQIHDDMSVVLHKHLKFMQHVCIIPDHNYFPDVTDRQRALFFIVPVFNGIVGQF